MNETQNQAVTQEELAAFVAAVSARHDVGLRQAYPTCAPNWATIVLEPGGKKFARLVTSRTVDPSQRSAFCFIDLSNGNILKAAGWKGPAKHARGNIRKGDASNLWDGAFTNHGGGLFISYLR